MKKLFLALIILHVAWAGCYTKLYQNRYVEDHPTEYQIPIIDSETYIHMTMVGGYMYGGVNPMTERNITIHDNGTVVLTMNQLYSDRFVGECRISRDEVEYIANLIIECGFFEMDDIYDCSSYNPDCWRRKKNYPRPVPLRLHVILGDIEKEVEVSVFEREMVDYPEELDMVVDEMITLSHRIIEDK